MHPNSLFAIRHWKLPEILFVGAACFAMAAFGFFIAVFLQLYFGPKEESLANLSSINVPIEDKARELEEVAANSPQPPASQADQTDDLAAAKLKILQSLGGQ